MRDHQVALGRQHIVKVVGEERDADHDADVAAPAQFRLLREVFIAEDEGGGEKEAIRVPLKVYVATLHDNRFVFGFQVGGKRGVKCLLMLGLVRVKRDVDVRG